jgi:hypothetical protein
MRIVVSIVVLAVLLTLAPPVAAQSSCRFVLGFAALRDLVGTQRVGNCLEDEHFNLENGNAEQRTTGGLMVWRKIDNFTAFTDGGTTWVNGPNGLQSRPNSERFSWERDPVQVGAISAAAPAESAPAPQPAAAPSTPTPAATPLPAPQASVDPAPIDVKGSGRKTTDPVALRSGILIAKSTYKGSGNFIVKLVDSNGKESELLANTVGDSSSTRVGRVATAGRYGLNVIADGPWTVRLEQPSPSDIAMLPKTFTGKGDGVTSWVRLPQGRVVANARMTSGQSNFIVYAVGADGARADLLANDVGASSNSKAFEGRGRVVVLSVQGDGEWSITLEP